MSFWAGLGVGGCEGVVGQGVGCRWRGLFFVGFGCGFAEGVEQGDEFPEVGGMAVCLEGCLVFPCLAYHHGVGAGDGLEEVVAFAAWFLEGGFCELAGYHQDF